MAHFEKTPDGYTITNAGQTVWLTPEQAYGLLRWLYDRRDELFTSIHPEAKQEMPDWLSASQEEAAKPPTVRYLEIRLDRRDWQYIGAQKAAMPALQEEYEAPSEERYQPVKVFSVKYDSLSQEALKLLNDLQIEMQFRDQAEM